MADTRANKLIKSGVDASFKRPTLKLIKQIFSLIDEEVYGNYILNKKRPVKFVLDDIEGSASTRIRDGVHYISINPNAFGADAIQLTYLIQLIESESVIVALDFYYDVTRNRDRPYDMFGMRRKCIAEQLFGIYLHQDRIPSKESVWFETSDGVIVEGKVIENVKDKQLTIVKAKDGTEHTVGDDKIYGSSRDDFFVEK